MARNGYPQVYYSEETHTLLVEAIEGRCEVRKRSDLPSCDAPTIYDHVFFCEYLYDPHKGSLKQVYFPAILYISMPLILYIVLWFI